MLLNRFNLVKCKVTLKSSTQCFKMQKLSQVIAQVKYGGSYTSKMVCQI